MGKEMNQMLIIHSLINNVSAIMSSFGQKISLKTITGHNKTDIPRVLIRLEYFPRILLDSEDKNHVCKFKKTIPKWYRNFTVLVAC